MKKYTLLLFVLALSACSTSQKITAVKTANGNLVGIANKASFLQAPYQGWFTRNYKNYNPDATTIAALSKQLKGVTIKGFMGTWCGDSKRQTPRVYQVLEQAGFNEKNMTLVTVNRRKKTPDNLQKGHHIVRVPTFIFYKDGKEIGRFVEYPRVTIEKDFLQIISGQPYKHSYEKPFPKKKNRH